VENVAVDELTVVMYDTNGKSIGNAKIKDNDDTTFDISHVFKNIGRHAAEILYNGNRVIPAFSFVVVPAEGRWGTVGEEFRLPIQVKNFQPNHLTFKVLHRDTKKVISNAEIRDSAQADAKYDIVFTPNLPGAHIIEMSLQGKNLPGSPVEVDIVPPPLVTLLTPSNEVHSIDEGATTPFARVSIHSSVQPDSLDVRISNSGGQHLGTANIADLGDGSFHLCWAPKVAGTYVANVHLNDLVVCGPITFQVQLDDS